MKNVGKIKKIILLFILCFSFFWNTFAYKELLIENRGGKPIRVIKVILDWQDFVVTSVANDWWATLESLVKKVWWDSGINGTFFCPVDYSYCGWVTHSNYERIYLGDGASYSASWPNTSVRVIFGFDIEWNPLMVQNNLTPFRDGALRSDINKNRINDLEFWMSNYTVLLLDWENVASVNVNKDKDRYTAWMASSANRNFICSTKDGSTIYMWVVGWISIQGLASYVKSRFDCYNALALDAGASEAMVYEWNVLERSSRRKIMDAFVVVDRDTYIKLTWYTPKKNEAYTGITYKLTDDDIEKINMLDVSLQQIINREWTDIKSKMKSVIRKAISTDEAKNDPQIRAIFHELLVRLFTVDKL